MARSILCANGLSPNNVGRHFFLDPTIKSWDDGLEKSWDDEVRKSRDDKVRKLWDNEVRKSWDEVRKAVLMSLP